MIKNERQYRITKAQVAKFESALDEVPSRENVHPLLAQLEADALRSQMTELQHQLEEYEALSSGAFGVISVESFDELPQALVRSRIAMGLNQKDLADRLGMKEQQIQRYEATDYQSASMARLREVIEALGVTVREEVVLPTKTTSVPAFFDRLKNAGIDRDFVSRRILPPAIAERVLCKSPNPTEVEMTNAATIVGRVFNWGVDELLGTKLRALYQRKKGRDLFDLWIAGQSAAVHADRVVECLQRYLNHEGFSLSRAEFEENLAAKCSDPRFLGDIAPLLAPSCPWDASDAQRYVQREFVSRLPGAPWKGGSEEFGKKR